MPLNRRQLLLGAALPAAVRAQSGAKMYLCMHQTTTAAAGYRRSLEGYAKAGIRYVEVIPPHVDEFVKQEGMPAARRLLTDLGIKAVASGGGRGVVQPKPERAALEEIKRLGETLAALGVDRMVCPCNTAGKFTLDDYPRTVDSLRQVGEILKPYKVVAMVEFMRGSTLVGTLPTALKVTREVNHPNVMPMFDFYHFGAGLSRLEDLDLVREGELHHVHFQDVPDIPRELLDNGTRDVPGDGVLPLVRILQILDRKKYRGPLSVELFYPHLQKGDPFEVARRIRQQSEPIMKRAGVA